LFIEIPNNAVMPMTLGNSDTLYIRIGGDRLIFARYDRVKDNTLNYRCFNVNKNMSLNANMLKALNSRSSLGEGAGRVYVCVDTPVTLVPLNEFDDDEMNDIYSYNFSSGNRPMRVFYDMLPLQNAVMLGAVDKDLEHTLLEAYPGATFHSCLMPLVLHYASLCEGNSGSGKMFVSTEGGNLTVASFRGNKLSLLNTFAGVKQVEDALYYIFSVARQWNIVPSADEVYVVGGGPFEQALSAQLGKYIPNTYPFNPSDVQGRRVQALLKDIPYDMIVLILKAF